MNHWESKTRREILLHDGWRFFRGECPGAEEADWDDSGWRRVSVPHDWAIEGPFDPSHDAEDIAILADGMETSVVHSGRSGALPVSGRGWYRRELPSLPGQSDWKKILIFDGAMSRSEVFINGQPVGGWPYGYTSFAVDLTDAWREEGGNHLAVSLNPPELTSRWYPGAGLYRMVRLLAIPKNHFSLWGTRITTSGGATGPAEVKITATIETAASGDTAEFSVEGILSDCDGNRVAETKAEVRGGRAEALAGIESPRLWSLESPHRYQAVLRLYRGGELVDEIVDTFGVREIGFHPTNGFTLNGSRIPLKGVCMHHDLGPLGAAFYISAAERQLRILRDMGVNAIRTAHNPADPGLLELCDRMGFLVIEEAFDEWKASKMTNGYHLLFEEWAEKDLRAMIRRDANHPCVIAWSIGNEVPEQHLENGKEVAAELARICREEDPTRPTTAGFNEINKAIANGLPEVVDLVGWNYATKHKGSRYGEFRERFPNQIQYGSETASTASSRGFYRFPVQEEPDARNDKDPALQMSSYELSALGWGALADLEFAALEDHPELLGEFVWCGFDYLGEPTPFYAEWPSRSSYFGVVDLCGIPKNRFYLYRSHWNREVETLHILPHWNWEDREGETVPVFVFSNHSKVELFVNGKSQGVRVKDAKSRLDRFRLRWMDVVYEPGEVCAVALDEENRELARAVVRTSGKAARIDLGLDAGEHPVADPLAPFFVTAKIVDAQGVPCPNANDRIFFEMDGPACRLATGNGDPTSLEIFGKDDYPAFHGSCSLVVGPEAGDGGELVIRARTESGLRGELGLTIHRKGGK